MRRLTKKGKERARQQGDGLEPAVPDYSLIPLTKPNHHRSKHDLPPLAYLHGRPVMTQPFNLPDRPTQSGFMLALGNSTTRGGDKDRPTNTPTVPLGSHNHEYANDYGNIDHGVFATPILVPSRSLHRTRRESQWTTWLTKTIPSIRDSYLDLLYRTKSLRNYPPEPIEHICTCEQHERRTLAVTVVTFTGKGEIVKYSQNLCLLVVRHHKGGLDHLPLPACRSSACRDRHVSLRPRTAHISGGYSRARIRVTTLPSSPAK